MRVIRHISVNIEGMLKIMKDRKIHCFNGDDGIPLSDKEARTNIAELQAIGHKLIGSDNCEGFDPFGGGCPGHPIKDE